AVPCCFFFSSRRRHTRFSRDWSSDVCSSDLGESGGPSALKPAPDGYLKAALSLGVSPEHCLVIGDRDDADGAAARAAGMAFRLKIGRASCREREETAATLVGSRKIKVVDRVN